jgi:hypothetical protein
MHLWKVVGASVTGSSHVRARRACDDAHAFVSRDDGTLLLAVADGAGSAIRAAEGSRVATMSMIECVGRALDRFGHPRTVTSWGKLLQGSLKGTRSALERASTSEECGQGALRDLATTLTFAAITDRWLAVVQIGDGAVVGYEHDEALRTLMPPSHGEYVNETDFVTGEDYLDRATYLVETHSMLRGVMLMTDGLTPLALEAQSSEPFAPFFMPIFRFANRPEASEGDLQAFLQSERVDARTDDDKTLLVAVRG